MLCAVDPLGLVIGIVACLVVVATIVFNVVRRLKGKNCCGGDCGKCGCSACREAQKRNGNAPTDPPTHA